MRQMTLGGLGALALMACAHGAGAQVPSAESQIAGALSAAPEALRATATVFGYRNYHRLEALKEGTGEMICLADDPSDDRWQVSCYHRDLEPFMKRGRDLKAEGKSRGQVDSVRLAEIKSGSLAMPTGPRSLFNLYASKDSVDQATGLAHHPGALQVVYIAYATQESTGLPIKPGDGLPWIMYPGMPWAHIMIAK
jgi:hypothetical protein